MRWFTILRQTAMIKPIMGKIRLQKFLSVGGVCSRRAAEVLIVGNKVKINNQVAKLGDKVDPGEDEVKVKGKIIKPSAEKIYLALNKPAGYTTTRSDRHADKTIYDLLPANLKNKVWPVGRLDKNSSGLLILTNDGELTQKLTHPKYQHPKEYLVKVAGELTKEKINRLERGIKIAGKKTMPAKIEAIKFNEIKIILREGRKRQICKMLEIVGCQVVFLQRVRESKLKLDNLPIGKYKTITIQDIM